MAKNTTKVAVKPAPKMEGGAAGGMGRIEKSALADKGGVRKVLHK